MFIFSYEWKRVPEIKLTNLFLMHPFPTLWQHHWKEASPFYVNVLFVPSRNRYKIQARRNEKNSGGAQSLSKNVRQFG